MSLLPFCVVWPFRCNILRTFRELIKYLHVSAKSAFGFQPLDTFYLSWSFQLFNLLCHHDTQSCHVYIIWTTFFLRILTESTPDVSQCLRAQLVKCWKIFWSEAAFCLPCRHLSHPVMNQDQIMFESTLEITRINGSKTRSVH